MSKQLDDWINSSLSSGKLLWLTLLSREQQDKVLEQFNEIYTLAYREGQLSIIEDE